MNSILKEIVKQKQKEVEILKMKAFDLAMENVNFSKSFKEILARDGLSIIAEIKRRSPSKGDISLIQDPMSLLHQYMEGGAAAISVLTDEKYFSGTIDDLIMVTEHLKHSKIPVLRKDFIIDEAQIDESVCCGANAILLIISVLEGKAERLLSYANSLGIDAIVEVHNEEELKYAVDIGAEIVGINNRDLNTFKEDINVCLNLIDHIPKHVFTIAESAVKSLTDVSKIKAAGFDAVLIGEALVKAEVPSELLRTMRGVV